MTSEILTETEFEKLLFRGQLNDTRRQKNYQLLEWSHSVILVNWSERLLYALSEISPKDHDMAYGKVVSDARIETKFFSLKELNAPEIMKV